MHLYFKTVFSSFISLACPPSSSEKSPQKAEENTVQKKKEDPRLIAADQASASGNLEAAARGYAAILEEFAKQSDPWRSRGSELESIRRKHADAIRDLLFNHAGRWKSAQ